MIYANCHPNQEHAAKGLCYSCYTKKRRADEGKVSRNRAGINKCHPDRLYYSLELCKSCYAKYRYIRHDKKHRKDNPEKQLQNDLRRYNLTVEAYQELLNIQNGVCAICGNTCSVKSRLSVDEDHADNNRIRGLLCDLCNKGLGHFKDNPILLKKAIDYLYQGNNMG